MSDDVAELLRLADQQERLERMWRERREVDPDDEEAALLHAISYAVSKKFWRLAYQLGDRIGWEPGEIPTKPFGLDVNDAASVAAVLNNAHGAVG